ncbi:homeobox-leucine zipper protein ANTHOCYANINLESS 2-like isoform X1 [Senna tora]|uniref:Homeobox-leucine zipper protein ANTHOCYANINLESS 2-like isoform X1 n=1 Tax=Senna tora TaxID=362788 RepID=A0A834W9C6_9FABA|nr:homeobox-leucine zipper protein ANTHOCYANINLESS 2-like isoform X1 [Senna tora]
MEGHVDMGVLGENFDAGLIGRIRDDGYESRSGSDNFEGVSLSGEDDQDGGDDTPQRRKKYHRHTPNQIQELESFFKECPHPDEKQRLELSKRLGLETKQVKFWFQNRRTQMKTQLERHENLILRQENDKLRAENSMMKDAMSNPTCNSCGGPAIPGQISFEEHQLRIENARLKDELNRICALANKFLGRPLSPMALPPSNSALDLAIGRTNTNINANHNGIAGAPGGPSFPMGLDLGMMMGNNDQAQLERSMLIDLALSAMEEMIKMAQPETPLWIKSMDGGEKEILNLEEYARTFSPCIGPKPASYITEATRDTGVVIINSLSLVETLMDANRWTEMFPTMVARALTLDVISNGMGGTRNGALQVMDAEVQLLSPLVPVRQVRLLRLCKQHAEGFWAVVDVSIEIGRDLSNPHPFATCRRLPSGCIVQDMPNGYSKVTWVEHWQYDESVVHRLYRPVVSSGVGFGAYRWIATLQRQCEYLAIIMSSSIPNEDHSSLSLSQGGRRSMVKLAQRMSDSFYAGVCGSSGRRWDKLHVGSLGDDVKVMTKKNEDEPGEPPGIVLSAATSVWLPVSRRRLFDFLRNKRSEWDILSNGGSMLEVVHIAKGQENGNCVSLLRTDGVNGNGNESNMLILQDAWTDTWCSVVVYAPVDVESLNVVMSGGDSSYVALLPSGFAILPDAGPGSPRGGGGGGSLLTVGLQILVSSLPTGKLTVESVDTVNNLISCTLQRIKASISRINE